MNLISLNITIGIVGAVLALPLLLIGVLMVRMGHWPKRQGCEPHCRKCSYILTGISSEHCPEFAHPRPAAAVLRFNFLRQQKDCRQYTESIYDLGRRLDLPAFTDKHWANN